MDLQLVVFLLEVVLFLHGSLSEPVSASLKPGDAEVRAQDVAIHFNNACISLFF